jgi:hypothetical protein
MALLRVFEGQRSTPSPQYYASSLPFEGEEMIRRVNFCAALSAAEMPTFCLIKIVSEWTIGSTQLTQSL